MSPLAREASEFASRVQNIEESGGAECWSAEVCRVTGGASGARRDSLEFGGGGALHEYARKWGPSPLSPPLGAALGPVGLRPVSAAPGAETAKYRSVRARTLYISALLYIINPVAVRACLFVHSKIYSSGLRS